MINEKFFVKEDGKLVILYEDNGSRHIAVCEPVEDVVMLSVGVKSGKTRKWGGKKKERTCKKCGEIGHNRKTCPKK